MWFLMQEGSRKGLLRALEQRGGRSLGYVGYTCDDAPSHQGENTVWASCLVHQERLFGPILERGGRFKFVSLANKL